MRERPLVNHRRDRRGSQECGTVTAINQQLDAATRGGGKRTIDLSDRRGFGIDTVHHTQILPDDGVFRMARKCTPCRIRVGDREVCGASIYYDDAVLAGGDHTFRTTVIPRRDQDWTRPQGLRARRARSSDRGGRGRSCTAHRTRPLRLRRRHVRHPHARLTTTTGTPLPNSRTPANRSATGDSSPTKTISQDCASIDGRAWGVCACCHTSLNR